MDFEDEKSQEKELEPVVRKRASDIQRAERLKELFRCLLLRIPYKDIAKEFDISIHQVKKDVETLRKTIAKQAQEYDINYYVGTAIATHNELNSKYMEIAFDYNQPTELRLAALSRCQVGMDKLNKFMKDVGLYDAIPFKPSLGQEGRSDMDKLMDLTSAILSMEEDEDGNLVLPDHIVERDDDPNDKDIDLL